MAIDTNVLSVLWSNEPLGSDIAKNLDNAKTKGTRDIGVIDAFVFTPTCPPVSPGIAEPGSALSTARW